MDDGQKAHSELDKAVLLALDGNHQEAASAFDALRAAAATSEDLAEIEIGRAVSLRNEEDSLLDLLEKFPDDLKATATFKVFLGTNETSPVKRVALLREACAANPPPSTLRRGFGSLVEAEFELGHASEAEARLLHALRTGDRRLRALAARLLAKQLEDSESPSARSLLLVFATTEPVPSNLREAVNFCFDKKLTPLGLHLCSLWNNVSQDGNSTLFRGLLRELAGLHSLAFRDYRSAASHGISVAKSNMATSLGVRPVPEAGLEILRDHDGTYDSVDPAGPYDVRARLERALHEEETKERRLLVAGRQLATGLQRLVEGWIRAGEEEVRTGKYYASSSVGAWVLKIGKKGTPELELERSPWVVSPLRYLDGFYVAQRSATDTQSAVFFVLGSEVEAVLIKDDPSPLEWLQFESNSRRKVASKPHPE